VVFYAGTMVLAGLASTGMWLYTWWRRDLLASGVTSRQLAHYLLRGLSMPAVFLASIFVALIDAGLAMWSWWLILVIRLAIARLWRD